MPLKKTSTIARIKKPKCITLETKETILKHKGGVPTSDFVEKHNMDK